MPQYLQTVAAFGVFLLVGFLILRSRPARASEIDFRVRVVMSVLLAEACGEGDAGQLAVAEVIRNRVARSGRSAYEIVTQRRQFSCLNDTTPERLVERQKVWANSSRDTLIYQLSRKLIFDPFSFDDDTTHGATHYHEKSVTPRWADPRKRVAIVGNHIFYRL